MLWGGLPAAIVLAVWLQFRAEGYAWGALWTPSFAVRLVCSLYFMGYVAGRALARAAGAAQLVCFGELVSMSTRPLRTTEIAPPRCPTWRCSSQPLFGLRGLAAALLFDASAAELKR